MISKIKRYFKQYLSDPNNKVGTRNQEVRDIWLQETLKKIPKGSRILDAAAGEQKYGRKNDCSKINGRSWQPNVSVCSRQKSGSPSQY